MTFTSSRTTTSKNRLNPFVPRAEANRLRPYSESGKSLFCRGFYVDESGAVKVVYTSTDQKEKITVNR